jgi:hypothetical protein
VRAGSFRRSGDAVVVELDLQVRVVETLDQAGALSVRYGTVGLPDRRAVQKQFGKLVVEPLEGNPGVVTGTAGYAAFRGS